MVAAGLVEECLVQFGYCIGRAVPVSVMVNSQGTDKLADKVLSKLVRQSFPSCRKAGLVLVPVPKVGMSRHKSINN